MTKNRSLIRRLGIYVAGLLILALGVSLAAASQLGVSALTAVPYVISEVTGMQFGTVTSIVFCVYVFLEWVLLGKNFKAAQLLQIPCAVLFGRLVTLTSTVVGLWQFSGYFPRFLGLILSILLTGVGIPVYLSADLIPQAADGLVQTLAKKMGKKLSYAKNLFDIASVTLAIVLSYAFLGKLTGVREGTLIAAVGVGRVIAFLKRYVK